MKHLKETNQTYFQHMRMALSNIPNAIFFIIYSSLMIPVMVIHAVAPFLFDGSIGTGLDYLHENEQQNRSATKPPRDRAPES